MQIEEPTECTSSQKDFSEHGCWYCRQNEFKSGFVCLQPCVKRLTAENIRLKAKITELTHRIEEIRNEV